MRLLSRTRCSKWMPSEEYVLPCAQTHNNIRLVLQCIAGAVLSTSRIQQEPIQTA